MKKITCRTGTIIMMIVVLFITPIATLAQFSSGSGIEGDPYIITTQTQLAQLATYVNAGTAPYANANVYYKLGSNITLSGNWTPIGNTTARTFVGVFDGDNKVINNLRLSGTYAGLFGIIGNE